MLSKVKWMTKFLVLLSVTSLFLGCLTNGANKYVTSFITIVKKEHSQDGSKAWVIAYDTYSHTKEQMKILVRKPMVWNLIEVNTTYFSDYSTEGSNSWVLDNISRPGDPTTLR